jgi:hypothetical protein
MTFEEIIALFPGGRLRNDREYDCCCPTHEDRRASLGIGRGDNGGVVVKCQAGCETATVIAAVGMTLADLAPPRLNGHVPAGETVYVYHDEQGHALFEVVRTPDKHFWQRLPGASKGGIGSVRRVLFELPMLLKTEPGATVFIVEGEKDCWRLWKLGLPATTNPGGAGKWRQDETDWLKEHLADREFVILPDNDAPGIKHADEIEGSLKHAGLDVRSLLLPGLPAKGDVSDWLGGGKTKEDLLAAIRPPPPRLWARVLSFTQLLEQPPPEWLIEGMFYEETMVEVFGEPNSGKSFVVIDECIALRRGGEWCGREIHRSGPVLYVNADGGRGFSKRARAWVEIHGEVEAPHEFWTLPEAINLCNADHMADLRALISYLPEAPVMTVFDTYSRCIPGMNENLQEYASMVVDHLDRMRQEFHMSVKLVHHTDLSGAHARGSSVIIGACDTQARVEKSPENVVTVKCEKQRDFEFFDPLFFKLGRVEGTNAVWITQQDTGPSEGPQERKESGINQVLQAVRDNPSITVGGLCLGLDMNERTVRRYVGTLLLRAQIVEADIPSQGLRGKPGRGLWPL